MASPALNKLRTTIVAQATTAKVKRQTATVRQKRAWMEQALCANGAYEVWERIDNCGTDRKRCGSLHCTQCFNRYVATQTRLMRALFANHTTEADQRANIRPLTVLFDAFGFDLHSKPYPTIVVQRINAARKHARKELYALKRRFSSITIVGALELDPIDGTAKALRKDSSAIDTLMVMGAHRGTAPGIHRLLTAPGMQQWVGHLLLYHGHFVVDLSHNQSAA